MGLVVDDIVDIVESKLSLELESPDVGFIGSAIVDEQATGVLDVPHYLKKAYGDWFVRRSSSTNVGVNANPSDILLLAENQFLRNLMGSYLNGIGFSVTEASSLNEASALKEAGETYDAILVDISLDMTGTEVPRVLTEDGVWSEALFVALTSEASAEEIDRAAVSGYSHCVEKGDREAMRQVLADSLTQGSVAA